MGMWGGRTAESLHPDTGLSFCRDHQVQPQFPCMASAGLYTLAYPIPRLALRPLLSGQLSPETYGGLCQVSSLSI